MDGLCRRLFLAVVCVMCSWEVVSAARWSHSAMLSPDYRLLWSLGPGPQDITFELQVRTLGYVGFGFSKDGRMAGADMVIGWVDHGQVYFQVRNNNFSILYHTTHLEFKQWAFRPFVTVLIKQYWIVLKYLAQPERATVIAVRNYSQIVCCYCVGVNRFWSPTFSIHRLCKVYLMFAPLLLTVCINTLLPL